MGHLGEGWLAGVYPKAAMRTSIDDGPQRWCSPVGVMGLVTSLDNPVVGADDPGHRLDPPASWWRQQCPIPTCAIAVLPRRGARRRDLSLAESFLMNGGHHVRAG